MNLKTLEENIFTDIVLYGRKKLSMHEGVKLADLISYLKGKGYNEVEMKGSNENRSMLSCLSQYFIKYGNQKHESTFRYYLTPQAFFGALSYDSYAHSLETARESKKLSLWAIGVSSTLAFVSIILSIIQLCSSNPMVILENQKPEINIDKLCEMAELQNRIINKLDSTANIINEGDQNK